MATDDFIVPEDEDTLWVGDRTWEGWSFFGKVGGAKCRVACGDFSRVKMIISHCYSMKP